MLTETEHNCRHAVWGTWPAHQRDHIVQWLADNVTERAYSWLMACSTPTATHLDHRFAFVRAEDLAIFLLAWPAHQVEQIRWEEYYEMVDNFARNAQVEEHDH